MQPLDELARMETRRHFFGKAAAGIGTAALASLLNPSLFAAGTAAAGRRRQLSARCRHCTFRPRPSGSSGCSWPTRLRSSTCSIHKPKMHEMFDKDLPESVRNGQRITTMTSGQARFPVAPSIFKFQQYGQVGRLAERAAAAVGDRWPTI